MDLVRQLLLEIEEKAAYPPRSIILFEIPEFSQDEIHYHIKLLVQADLVEGQESFRNDGKWVATGLTWKGHELLDTIRDENVWRKTKRLAGNMSLEIIKQTAASILLNTVKQSLG